MASLVTPGAREASALVAAVPPVVEEPVDVEADLPDVQPARRASEVAAARARSRGLRIGPSFVGRRIFPRVGRAVGSGRSAYVVERSSVGASAGEPESATSPVDAAASLEPDGSDEAAAPAGAAWLLRSMARSSVPR